MNKDLKVKQSEMTQEKAIVNSFIFEDLRELYEKHRFGDDKKIVDLSTLEMLESFQESRHALRVMEVAVEDQKIEAFLDTGADLNMITEQHVPLNARRWKKPVEIDTVMGKLVLEDWAAIPIMTPYSPVPLIIPCVVLNKGSWKLPSPLLLGLDFFALEFRWSKIDSRSDRKHFSVEFCISPRLQSLTKGNYVQNMTEDSELVQEAINKAKHNFEHSKGVFGGEENTVKLKWKNPNKLPENLKPYVRIWAPEEERIIQMEIESLLKQGVIEPTDGSYCVHQLVIVDKANGEKRVCVDLRRLNEFLASSHVHLNLIEALIIKASAASVFSELDVKSAFFHCPVFEADTQYLTFTFNNRRYKYVRACFGLKFMTAFFTECLQRILGDIPGVFIYVDNIVVATNTVQEHKAALDEVFERLFKGGVKLNPEKCKFYKNQISLLGWLVSEGRRDPDPEKIKAIANTPKPKNVAELQQLLGMLNFIRGHIPRISEILKPLYTLCSNKVSWKWDETHDSAFIKALDAARGAISLSCMPTDAVPVLFTDASNTAVSGVLGFLANMDKSVIIDRFEIAKIVRNKDKACFIPVALYSSSLKGMELNYGIFRKETLALLRALDEFRRFIWGRPVVAFTDNKSLVWATRCCSTSSVAAAWQLKLDSYDLIVNHLPGVVNKLADALTRYARPEEELVPVVAAASVASFGMTTRSKSGAARTADLSTENEDDTVTQVSPTRPNPEPSQVPNPELTKEQKINLIEEVHNRTHADAATCVQTLRREGKNWMGIHDDCFHHVWTCIECAKWNIGKRAHLKACNTATAHRPMQRIAVDIKDKKCTTQGNCAYLVAIDIFSRFKFAIPIKSKTAEEVFKALQRVFMFGWPAVIQTDNGPEFKGNVFKKMCETYGMEHHKTTAHHSQSNGMVERAIGSIDNALNKVCGASGTEWDHSLEMVVNELNNQVRGGEQLAPFELMFGREARTGPVSDHSPEDDDIWFSLLAHLQEDVFVSTMIENTENDRVRRERLDHTRFTTGHRFEIGDTVMMYRLKRPGKELPPYAGPYTVKQVLPNGTYELENLWGGKLHKNANHNLLKLTSPHLANIKDFEVRAIRAHKDENGSRQYLVAWREAGPSMDQWIPADKIAPAVIARYERMKDQIQERKMNNTRKRGAERNEAHSLKRKRVQEAQAQKEAWERQESSDSEE